MDETKKAGASAAPDETDVERGERLLAAMKAIAKDPKRNVRVEHFGSKDGRAGLVTELFHDPAVTLQYGASMHDEPVYVVTYEPRVSRRLTREQAINYATWLEAGNAGTHEQLEEAVALCRAGVAAQRAAQAGPPARDPSALPRKLAGFREGNPVWYQPSENGRRYAGVVHRVHADPQGCAETLSLREMDDAYGIDVRGRPGERFVGAAAVACVIPRAVPPTCGEPGCVCAVKYDPAWATDVRDDHFPAYCGCTSFALRAALRQATRDRDGWRKSFEQLAGHALAAVRADRDAVIPKDGEDDDRDDRTRREDAMEAAIVGMRSMLSAWESVPK